MGPFGIPGASIPGPPGPKVCILGNIFFLFLRQLGRGNGIHDTGQLEF